MRGVFLDTQTMAPDSLDFSALMATLPDWQLHGATTPEDVAPRLAQADVVVTNKVVLDRAVLEAVPHLKLVCVSATGTNNVDTEAAREMGIPVCNVSGYAGASVAQHTLALMLGLATRWHEYQQDVQGGEWSQSPMFCLMQRPVVELAGKHLVIVGAGALGQAVATLARAFGMRVSFAASLAPGAAADAARPPLSRLLPQADWVSLHCPLTDQTRTLVNDAFLRQMPAHGFLVNTARGGLVDEPALAAALREGRIAGAALDVLGEEPPPADHPLLATDIPNLVLTPHNAWISRECRQRLLDGVTANIRAWRGGRLTNCVNGMELT